jgi:hypothetical protein
MSRRPIKSDAPVSFADATGKERIDQDVQLPEQVLHAAALANALVTGEPLAPVPARKRTRSDPKISCTDGEVDEALQRLDRGDVRISGPQSTIIIELAREGARLIKAHRRGARKERKNSPAVTRRLEAVLHGYRELPSHLQKRPMGKGTLLALRRRVSAKISPQHISDDTIKKDIEQFLPLLRLVRLAVIPPAGKQINKQQTISERTRQEMEAGKRAVAKAAAASRPHTPSND